MSSLILIRGLPGSGKSTMAKRDFPDHIHLEADMYFVDEDGTYRFNSKKIRDAHEWCQEKTLESLRAGHNVVVSNTFTQIWEMEVYFKINFPTTVFEAYGNYENIHSVPKDVIANMAKRWEEFR